MERRSARNLLIKVAVVVAVVVLAISGVRMLLPPRLPAGLRILNPGYCVVITDEYGAGLEPKGLTMFDSIRSVQACNHLVLGETSCYRPGETPSTAEPGSAWFIIDTSRHNAVVRFDSYDQFRKEAKKMGVDHVRLRTIIFVLE